MAAPRIDIGALAERLEQISPALSRAVVSSFLGLASPFNGKLRARLVEWGPTRCVFRLKNRRRVRNHLGGTHAGALVSLGESAAGLLLLRNFSFGEYRLILKEIKADYEKQGRGTLTATAERSPEEIERIRESLQRDAVFLEMITTIERADGQTVARIYTHWQLKRWDQVGRTRSMPGQERAAS